VVGLRWLDSEIVKSDTCFTHHFLFRLVRSGDPARLITEYGNSAVSR
jgi:hypothetical protein